MEGYGTGGYADHVAAFLWIDNIVCSSSCSENTSCSVSDILLAFSCPYRLPIPMCALCLFVLVQLHVVESQQTGIIRTEYTKWIQEQSNLGNLVGCLPKFFQDVTTSPCVGANASGFYLSLCCLWLWFVYKVNWVRLNDTYRAKFNETAAVNWFVESAEGLPYGYHNCTFLHLSAVRAKILPNGLSDIFGWIDTVVCKCATNNRNQQALLLFMACTLWFFLFVSLSFCHRSSQWFHHAFANHQSNTHHHRCPL